MKPRHAKPAAASAVPVRPVPPPAVVKRHEIVPIPQAPVRVPVPASEHDVR